MGFAFGSVGFHKGFLVTFTGCQSSDKGSPADKKVSFKNTGR